jgi:predicted transposase/invertase (TIGR01784 family)
MQVCKELDFFQRTLYYWARLFVNNFNSGEKYEELKPTICINFLDCKLLKTDNFFSHYIPKEYERNEIEDELAKQFNIYFIELPKLNITDWSDISELELWVKFLNAKSKEDLDMIEKANNPIINEAVSKLRDYNDDERARELAFKRERAITDYNHRFEKGVEKGIAIGEAKGIAQEKIKNILASYNEGIKTNLIARIFKMSVAEVEEIINSNGKVTSNE